MGLRLVSVLGVTWIPTKPVIARSFSGLRFCETRTAGLACWPVCVSGMTCKARPVAATVGHSRRLVRSNERTCYILTLMIGY